MGWIGVNTGIEFRCEIISGVDTGMFNTNSATIQHRHSFVLNWCWIGVGTGKCPTGLNWCQHFLHLLLSMHLCPWFLIASIAQLVKALPKKTYSTPVQHWSSRPELVIYVPVLTPAIFNTFVNTKYIKLTTYRCQHPENGVWKPVLNKLQLRPRYGKRLCLFSPSIFYRVRRVNLNK